MLHNEYHHESFSKSGGVMHMMQLWVNLPKKHKLTSAKYQALALADIPEVALPKGGGKVRVIAGVHEGTKGPARTFTPARMLDLRLKPGAKVRLTAPKDFNTALLVLGGEARANGSSVLKDGDFLLFKNDGTAVSVVALTEVTALFLSGAPIDEPLVHYGPFVMNTVDEINQAVEDYRDGKFGELAD